MNKLLVLMVLIVLLIIFFMLKNENFESNFNNNILKKIYTIDDDLKMSEKNLNINYI